MEKTKSITQDPQQVPAGSPASAADLRPRRFLSHALVEVGRYKWLPLARQSAILMDVSMGGFKIEFMGKCKMKSGEGAWLRIPLRPIGIFSPTRFETEVQVRWIDEKRCRMGGTFVDLSAPDQRILEQIITALTSRGDAF